MRGSGTPTILLIEDSPVQARLIRQTLHDHFGEDRVVHVATLGEAQSADLSGIDLVFTDLNLPDGTGLELLPQLLNRRVDLPVVFLTAEGNYDVALDAIRGGAYDYVVKAGDYLAALPVLVEKNLAIWRTKRENALLNGQLMQALDNLRQKNEQLESVVSQLQEMVTTDPLTGAANRRAFNDAMERMFDEAVRYGHDLSCVMIDLDRFKTFNDGCGHQAGDELLRRLGRVLKMNCRHSDVAARFGGDEFVLLLPHTDAGTAAHACGRVAEEFALLTGDLFAQVPDVPRVTVSMGIASIRATVPTSTSQLISHADHALYLAKEHRDGRIVTFLPEAPTRQAVA